jgi:hypothetical protein
MRLFSLPTTLWSAAALTLLAANSRPLFAPPTDIQQPGTQPGQAFLMGGVQSCEGCHGYYDDAVEPYANWMGSMMAHSGRDPVFWAALAVAEGDIPGAGDYCIRCHSPRGWNEGRTSPSDGSALNPATDADGIECSICHNMVDQNAREHFGMQFPPYMANNGGNPAEGYYGSGMVVLAGNSVRYGPYAQTTASHPYAQSLYHRSSTMCGTCHDVSNPLVGDLAPGNGAQQPLPPGSFSGVPNTPVNTKAAFNNFPFQYGIVERTFSEHMASAFPTTPVSAYNSLPADLKRGAIARARQQSLLAGQGGNYEDGTQRFFTCQTCHVEPVVGMGAAFGVAPVRFDQPLHDMTGANTWVPEAIKWLDARNRLRLGGGLTPVQTAAMDRGVLRARASLQRAGALDLNGNTLRVTNLTGHKLISGYPEGRRMWLRTTWKNEQGAVLREDGSYGSFTTNIQGTPYTVQSITDPNARVYEAKLGITQDWALQLLGLGVDPNTPLSFDRVTGQPVMSLVQLASSAPGTVHETFHFVLNNKLVSDNRIPPYGFRRDEAARRNALPVPATQFGNPGPGGTYNHFDDVQLNPPPGATRAEIELLYQTSSFEYIQFLRLANPGTNTFLQNTGIDLFDAWRNTGQSAPERMALARWCNLPGTGEDLVLESGINGNTPDTTCGKQVEPGSNVTYRVRSPNNTFAGNVGALAYQLHDASAPPAPFLPGLRLDRVDATVTLIGVNAAGATANLAIPTWLGPMMIRTQAVMLGAPAANGVYATSNALDIWL